jgi:hypothetical protein
MAKYPNSGMLHFNSPEQKKNPKSPDWSGKGEVDGKPKCFAAWINEGKKGGRYLIVKVIDPYVRKDRPEAEDTKPNPSEDVPPIDQGEPDPF